MTLDQAKAWLRVESGGDEDALIGALIPAARARAEWHTGRAFVTQHWTLWLDSPGDGCIEIPLAPLVSVESVTLHAPDGTVTVLATDAYQIDVMGGRVLLAGPHPDLRAVNAVAIAFTAGYGDAGDVPAPISSAILQIVSSLYDHRGSDTVPTPDSALALLAPYRTIRI